MGILFCNCMWEDNRAYGEDGKVQGDVRNRCTGAKYGTVIKDSNMILRKKFVQLSLATPVIGVITRIPLRLVQLVSGDFIDIGTKLAFEKWKQEQADWALLSKEERQQTPYPSTDRLNSLERRLVLWQFVKNVVKLATLSLAIVAATFAALYGLIRPLDGRALYSSIEYLWSRDGIDPERKGRIWTFGEFLAPCLQPQEVQESLNLYQALFPDYHPGTLRSLMVTISTTLKQYRAFWEKNEIDVDDCLASIAAYRANVKLISKSDALETVYTKDIKIEASNVKIEDPNVKIPNGDDKRDFSANYKGCALSYKATSHPHIVEGAHDAFVALIGDLEELRVQCQRISIKIVNEQSYQDEERKITQIKSLIKERFATLNECFAIDQGKQDQSEQAAG